MGLVDEGGVGERKEVRVGRIGREKKQMGFLEMKLLPLAQPDVGSAVSWKWRAKGVTGSWLFPDGCLSRSCCLSVGW